MLLEKPMRLLSGAVGNNLDNNIDDVALLKNYFAQDGRYNKPVENGYIDKELDDAIYGMQRDHHLKVDGKVNPGGETEATLVGSIMGLTSPREKNKDQPSYMKNAVAAPLVLPALAESLAQLLGMTSAAAWAYWQSKTPKEREELLSRLNKPKDGDGDGPCEESYLKDGSTCAKITAVKGAQAGAVCRGCATERYAACLAGKPEDDWPELPR